MPTELDKVLDWAKGVSFAVTVCDREGFIIYMNDKSKATFAKHGDIMGNSLKDCHSTRSWETIVRLLQKGESNTYTILKNGVKKIIHQTPWYTQEILSSEDVEQQCVKQVGGLVEISIVIPEEVSHFVRG